MSWEPNYEYLAQKVGIKDKQMLKKKILAYVKNQNLKELAKDVEIKERDDRGEEEYERRAEGMPAKQAAAIAVEISADRHKEEKSLPTKTDASSSDGNRD